MQVDDTSGPLAPVTSPPMPPSVFSAPLAGAIPIPHFLVGLFSRSSFLSLTFIYLFSLLLHLRPLLVLTAVLPRKVYFYFPFAFLLSKLSFYSSHHLSCYPGLLQTGYSCSELHAPLLFSSHLL